MGRKSSLLASTLRTLIREMNHADQDAFETVLEWLEYLEGRVEKLESEK